LTAGEKIYQRFATLALWYSLSSNTIDPPNADECSWTEIDCTEARVTKIHMARKKFNGSISPMIGHLKDLVWLDLAENEIVGSIPEQVYNLTNLRGLFLHQNQLTGTISNSIGNLYEMTHFYACENKLSGSLPKRIGSSTFGPTRKLRMLSLGSNDFSGTLPTYLRLTELTYLDLSHNGFHGSIPNTFFQEFDKIKVLYMDHNDLSGTIPESLVLAGGERLNAFYLNDNGFTGRLPYSPSWVSNNTRLQTIDVKHNYFMAPISQPICEMSVFEYGDIVQLEADCTVCWCDVFCDYCETDDDVYDDILYDDNWDDDDSVNGTDDDDGYDDGYDDDDDDGDGDNFNSPMYGDDDWMYQDDTMSVQSILENVDVQQEDDDEWR